MTDTTLKNQKDEINTLINEVGMRCTSRLANLFMNDSLLIPIKESTEKDNNEYKSVLTRKKRWSPKENALAQAFTLSAEHGSLNTCCTGFYTQCGAWLKWVSQQLYKGFYTQCTCFSKNCPMPEHLLWKWDALNGERAVNQLKKRILTSTQLRRSCIHVFPHIPDEAYRNYMMVLCEARNIKSSKVIPWIAY